MGIAWIEEKLDDKRDAETDKVLADAKKAALDVASLILWFIIRQTMLYFFSI